MRGHYSYNDAKMHLHSTMFLLIQVVRAEGILRKNMVEVILICEILACNTDAWDDVKDTQEEIARKWVELMMKEEEK